MIIDIVTIFPEMFDGVINTSILKRAREGGLVEINIHNLRKWANNRYRQVDDKPFSGGPGMVMMIEPIANAINDLKDKDKKSDVKTAVIAMTAKGKTFKQSIAKKLTEFSHLIILAGHYEGFDQRILDDLTDFNISIGNYVLTGGELPAMVVMDAVTRLIPGVLGNEESPKNDSFFKDDKSIQHPIYTRPREFEYKGKILKVPDVLLSGDEKKIKEWQKEYQNNKSN